MSDIVITPPTMSSRSWDGVRLRRRGWKHTRTHTCSLALFHANMWPPCLFRHYPSLEPPSFFSFFFLPPVRQAETQFHTHVSPSCELIHSETTTIGCGEKKKKKKRISLYKHHRCLVRWMSKATLTLCRWNIGDKAEEMCMLWCYLEVFLLLTGH